MKNIKKVIFLFLSTICLTFLLCACNSDSNQNTSVNSDEPTKNESLEKALELERPYYKDIENAIKTLRNRETYPNSFKINHLYVYIDNKSSGRTTFLINYSAKNSQGTISSSTISCDRGCLVILNDDWMYDSSKALVDVHNSTYSEADGEYYGYYQSTNMDIFELNTDDYVNQGYYLP